MSSTGGGIVPGPHSSVFVPRDLVKKMLHELPHGHPLREEIQHVLDEAPENPPGGTKPE